MENPTEYKDVAQRIREYIEDAVAEEKHLLWLPRMVGFSGAAESGKSESADFLAIAHRYKIYSFARRLKNAVYDLLNANTYKKEQRNFHLGGVSTREILQYFGTDICRELFGPYFFVWMEAQYILNHENEHSKRIVYDDVRFQEEAEWILKCGGKLIHLTRSGADGKVGIPGHKSEQGYDSSNESIFRKGENYFEIENNGTIFDLGYQINKILVV